MALRAEAFLDTEKIETSTGVTYGVGRPTVSGPINPTRPNDGTHPDWGWGYSTAWEEDGDAVIFAGVFESSSIVTVHLQRSVWDGATLSNPPLGIITFNGNTDNALNTPGGYTRTFYRVYWDEVAGGYVCTVQGNQSGLPMSIKLYGPNATGQTAWGSAVKTISAGVGGFCEPMAYGRRADGRAFVYYQYVTSGHASAYGGLNRHVGMVLGPSDQSLTGTWTDVGRILTCPSDAHQFYHAGCWADGELLYVPIGIFDGTAAGAPPATGTFNGTINRIWKVALYVARLEDPSTLTLVDDDWITTTGVYGDWFGGEVVVGNTPARIGTNLLWPVGGDGNTHHQPPEAIRMLGLATVGDGRIGYITGTGSARTTLITATAAGQVTINSTGTVEVELLDASNAVISGYARADCDAIPADTFGHTVTWNGSRVTPASFKVKLYLTAGTVYYLTASEVDGLTAEGYGNTVSAGYGSATMFTDTASILIDPASTAWEQIGTTITVRVTAATPPLARTVQATVNSPGGGLLRFQGADASLFAASLDGTAWASMIDVPAGESTVSLSVTPVSPGSTLTAQIGVPV